MFSEFGKEVSENFSARTSENARSKTDRVIMSSLEKPVLRDYRTGFRVRRTEIDMTDASLYDRSGAHGTWLQRHVQVAVLEAPGTEPATGLSDRDHFRVKCCVLTELAEIMRASNHGPVVYDHASNGAVSDHSGTTCLRECLGHVFFVYVQTVHTTKYNTKGV